MICDFSSCCETTRPGRDVRDADRRVGRVDALAAGSARAERVDAQVFRVDLDVDLFGLRQHGDRRRRGVDAAARFGRRHALHAVDAALVLQPAVDALAFDERDDFLGAAAARLAQVEHLEPPALALGVARVHAEEVRREERRFVAAGARADFQHDVLRVVRVLRNEQDLQVGEQRVAPRLERRQLLLRELAHVGILDQLFGRGDLGDDVLVLAESLDQRLHLRERLRVRAELRRIGLDGRVGHLGHQLFVLRFSRRSACRTCVTCRPLSLRLALDQPFAEARRAAGAWRR